MRDKEWLICPSIFASICLTHELGADTNEVTNIHSGWLAIAQHQGLVIVRSYRKKNFFFWVGGVGGLGTCHAHWWGWGWVQEGDDGQ